MASLKDRYDACIQGASDPTLLVDIWYDRQRFLEALQEISDVGSGDDCREIAREALGILWKEPK